MLLDNADGSVRQHGRLEIVMQQLLERVAKAVEDMDAAAPVSAVDEAKGAPVRLPWLAWLDPNAHGDRPRLRLPAGM